MRRGLRVLVVHAGVADVRRRHHDDLAGVARVGQGLLVAGHAGREDGLAEGAAAGAVGAAGVAGAVFEHEHGGVGGMRWLISCLARGRGRGRPSRHGDGSGVGSEREVGVDARCRARGAQRTNDQAVGARRRGRSPGGAADAADRGRRDEARRLGRRDRGRCRARRRRHDGARPEAEPRDREPLERLRRRASWRRRAGRRRGWRSPRSAGGAAGSPMPACVAAPCAPAQAPAARRPRRRRATMTIAPISDPIHGPRVLAASRSDAVEHRRRRRRGASRRPRPGSSRPRYGEFTLRAVQVGRVTNTLVAAGRRA